MLCDELFTGDWIHSAAVPLHYLQGKEHFVQLLDVKAIRLVPSSGVNEGGSGRALRPTGRAEGRD